jgi:hypothetical protein
MAINLWIWLIVWVSPLLQERPPGQVFVHVTFRIIILGSLIAIVYFGRKAAQKWQRRRTENERNEHAG